MTYAEIKKANEQLAPMDIKGKDYVDVAQRVQAFRSIMPGGAIITDLLSCEDGVCTFKATVYDADGKILATGHAQEKETSSYINKTSFIENCETSAVGRALGFIGIGSETSIASFEEVANAINNQQPKTDKKPYNAKSAPVSATEGETELTYEQALETMFQGRKLRDIYKMDRAFISDIYKSCPNNVKKAIEVINKRIKEANG